MNECIGRKVCVCEWHAQREDDDTLLTHATLANRTRCPLLFEHLSSFSLSCIADLPLSGQRLSTLVPFPDPQHPQTPNPKHRHRLGAFTNHRAVGRFHEKPAAAADCLSDM